MNIKFIYLSTNYVYRGLKGNYKETDSLKPWNNYAWSKLGGECAAQMYKNSLIIRVCMTEKPFIHKKAYANVKLNFMFQEDAAKLVLKIIDKKGIINLGGPSQTIYNFAKNDNFDETLRYINASASYGGPNRVFQEATGSVIIQNTLSLTNKEFRYFYTSSEDYEKSNIYTNDKSTYNWIVRLHW